MIQYKYFGSFTLYILILIFVFSITVTNIDSLRIVHNISYSVLHFIVIYLGLYYYRKTLYLIFFLSGINLDLLLLNNEIGPHLLTFMLMLLFFNFTKKLIQNFDSRKIFFIILIYQATMIFCEKILISFLYNYDFHLYDFLQIIFISLLISYPLFYIFSKIDELK